MNLICRIMFDAAHVEAGELLTGRVRLLEDTPSVAKAQKLRLRAICRIEGPEEPEERVLNTAELPGPFRTQVDIPFRIPIPEQGPITYQGVILHIGWRLEVQLLVPGSSAPRRDMDFEVTPARGPAPRRRHPKAPAP
jgi:hypothetical protein